MQVILIPSDKHILLYCARSGEKKKATDVWEVASVGIGEYRLCNLGKPDSYPNPLFISSIILAYLNFKFFIT